MLRWGGGGVDNVLWHQPYCKVSACYPVFSWKVHAYRETNAIIKHVFSTKIYFVEKRGFYYTVIYCISLGPWYTISPKNPSYLLHTTEYTFELQRLFYEMQAFLSLRSSYTGALHLHFCLQFSTFSVFIIRCFVLIRQIIQQISVLPSIVDSSIKRSSVLCMFLFHSPVKILTRFIFYPLNCSFILYLLFIYLFILIFFVLPNFHSFLQCVLNLPSLLSSAY